MISRSTIAFDQGKTKEMALNDVHDVVEGALDLDRRQNDRLTCSAAAEMMPACASLHLRSMPGLRVITHKAHTTKSNRTTEISAPRIAPVVIQSALGCVVRAGDSLSAANTGNPGDIYAVRELGQGRRFDAVATCPNSNMQVRPYLRSRFRSDVVRECLCASF